MKGKKYGLVVMDPPWSYKNKNTGGSMTSGAVNKYPTLSLEELKKLPITDLCDKKNGSIVVIWATTPMLPEAFELIKAWGLKYKTNITWIKTGKIGMGYWLRVNTEHAILCTYGNPPPLKSTVRNHFEAKPGIHSAKPDIFYDVIEEIIDQSAMVNKSAIDIFARKHRKGWSSIGLDLYKQEIGSWMQLIGGTKSLKQLAEGK